MRKTNKQKFAYSYVDILLLQIVKVEQIPFLSAFYKKKLSEKCCYILFEHSKIIKGI